MLLTKLIGENFLESENVKIKYINTIRFDIELMK